MLGVGARGLCVGLGVVLIGGALNGCGGSLGNGGNTGGKGGFPDSTGRAGTMGAAGRGGQGGTGGGAGTGSAFGEPACLSTVSKGGACTPTDQQFCYKTCGPARLGVKSETCTGGFYAE